MHNCYYSFDFCFCSCAVGHLESSPAQQLLGKLYDELWTWPTFFLSCIPSPGPCNVILYLFSLRSDTIFYPWIWIGLLTFLGQWDISKNDRNQGLKKNICTLGITFLWLWKLSTTMWTSPGKSAWGKKNIWNKIELLKQRTTPSAQSPLDLTSPIFPGSSLQIHTWL